MRTSPEESVFITQRCCFYSLRTSPKLGQRSKNFGYTCPVSSAADVSEEMVPLSQNLVGLFLVADLFSSAVD
ncbi:hypothetical protein BaRGS_00004647, partial [Batillaria attramentaria]